MSDQFFWYVTRSSALVSWLFAAFSILLGLMTSSRLLGRRPTIPWLVDLHRMLAKLSVTFLLIHMASLWFDSFVQFRLAELLVPWYATVPGLTRTSLALGVIGAWLLAAVQISSLLKDQIPDSWWRATHQLSFLTLILGTFHAIQAGSDIENPIVIAIGASLWTAIVLLGLLRLYRMADTRMKAGAAGPARVSSTRTGDVPNPVTPVTAGDDQQPLPQAGPPKHRRTGPQPVLSQAGAPEHRQPESQPMLFGDNPPDPTSTGPQPLLPQTGPPEHRQGEPRPMLFGDDPPDPTSTGPQPLLSQTGLPERPLPPVRHLPPQHDQDQDPTTTTGRLPISRSTPSETRPPGAGRPPRPEHRG